VLEEFTAVLSNCSLTSWIRGGSGHSKGEADWNGGRKKMKKLVKENRKRKLKEYEYKREIRILQAKQE
jgi:hypothetical protein